MDSLRSFVEFCTHLKQHGSSTDAEPPQPAPQHSQVAGLRCGFAFPTPQQAFHKWDTLRSSTRQHTTAAFTGTLAQLQKRVRGTKRPTQQQLSILGWDATVKPVGPAHLPTKMAVDLAAVRQLPAGLGRWWGSSWSPVSIECMCRMSDTSTLLPSTSLLTCRSGLYFRNGCRCESFRWPSFL